MACRCAWSGHSNKNYGSFGYIFSWKSKNPNTKKWNIMLPSFFFYNGNWNKNGHFSWTLFCNFTQTFLNIVLLRSMHFHQCSSTVTNCFTIWQEVMYQMFLPFWEDMEVTWSKVYAILHRVQNSKTSLLCFRQTYILKIPSCITQFTALWIISPGFSSKPSSDLFIITSYTKNLILACGIEISFPYNMHHKNLC